MASPCTQGVAPVTCLATYPAELTLPYTAAVARSITSSVRSSARNVTRFRMKLSPTFSHTRTLASSRSAMWSVVLNF